MTRYTFDEVRAALREHWGLALYRGESTRAADKHDGRWDVVHSKTGFIVGGNMPGRGHSYRRFRSLKDVVRVSDLTKVIEKGRRG